MKVFVVGASNVDIIAKSTGKAIAGDSNVGTVEKAPGGVARNIACALRALGFHVSFLSAVADDENGQLILDSLAQAKITACFKSLPSDVVRTGVYCCILDGDGSMVCAVNEMGITQTITPDLVLGCREAIESSDYLVMDANLPEDTIRTICSLDVRVIADAVSTAKVGKFSDSLENIYLLKANFMEACALAGVDVVEADADGIQLVMEALVAKGLRRAIISLGKDGAFCYEVSGTGTRGFDAKAIDSPTFMSANGCGDVLLAAFLRALSEGLPIEDALYYGQAASAINSESLEAVSPALSFGNVKKKVEEHYEQISGSDR